jgi:predicted RNA binding protein YcfA (HicA-like mRNA interferase family)
LSVKHQINEGLDLVVITKVQPEIRPEVTRKMRKSFEKPRIARILFAGPAAGLAKSWPACSRFSRPAIVTSDEIQRSGSTPRTEGFRLIKEKGSIRYCAKTGHPHLIRVDFHGAKEVPTGTCHAILKAAGLKRK